LGKNHGAHLALKGPVFKPGSLKNQTQKIRIRVDFPIRTILSNNDNWLVVSTYPSEKYEFVSWDDDIPNMMGKS